MPFNWILALGTQCESALAPKILCSNFKITHNDFEHRESADMWERSMSVQTSILAICIFFFLLLLWNIDVLDEYEFSFQSFKLSSFSK